MATIHIESNKEDISPLVLMPGDPLRAKYIAENFLDDYKLVNTVRNMFAYTGYYKGKRITVFASGMGMASMGIYCHELYNFYDVEKIIRIGTCGAGNETVGIGDVIIADKAYTNSNWGLLHCGYDKNYDIADPSLINDLKSNANSKVLIGNVFTTDLFDIYLKNPDNKRMHPEGISILANEMETFALFHTANEYQKKAACVLTCVDSKYTEQKLSSEEREKSLNEMIILALEAI